MNKGEFLFLGTGASSGTPAIGCSCKVCTSTDPHNKRLRPSALVMIDHKKILIDSGPDFRIQALRYHIDHLDGILITHTHFDHVAGLDELRAYYLIHRKPIPVLVSKDSLSDLKRRYDYLFREKSSAKSLPAQLDFHILKEERGSIDFLEIPIRYMSYEQADMKVNGYRFGDLAYISDIRVFPETIFEDLTGIKTLVLGAIGYESSMMHFSFEEAIAFSRNIGVEKTYLTHMSHRIDYKQANALLPKGFSLAYDGLKEVFSYGS